MGLRMAGGADVTGAAFSGTLVSARGGGHAITVGDEVVASMGVKHMSRVRGTVNGVSFRSSVIRYGGRMYLGVHKATVEAAGLEVGAPVSVELEPDTELREADITPPVLDEALRRSPAARAAWEALAPSHRREYVGFITEAKRDETRARRVERTIEELEGR